MIECKQASNYYLSFCRNLLLHRCFYTAQNNCDWFERRPDMLYNFLPFALVFYTDYYVRDLER